ncbi:hypothetical protein [Algisphaera agarilytica]|uniref:Uncharacterized protein n=1 Tax=Algisphaera agarilytica TaxID=1385975 RepID=A0A7X0LM90_9BACT|nr:hypothetical protein [Algisphaera agarilytica]MBB6431714.1 hypothetical protein [Algisphaera agarilytica]
MTDTPSMIEELLDRDLSPRDLERLAQIASTLEKDPELAQDFEQLHRIRQRLSDTAEHSELSRADEDGFVELALGSIQASTPTPSLGNRPTRPYPRGSWTYALVGGAVAAALTLAFVVGLRGFDGSGETASSPATTLANDDPTRWLPDSPSEQSAILADLAGFYDHRAGWIATTDNDTQIGLSDTAIHGLQPTVTRLSLITPDQEYLTTDIALFPGQDVTVTVPRPDRQPLRYKLHLSKSVEPSQPSTLTVGLFLDADLYLSTTVRIDNMTIQDVGRIHTPRGDYVLRLGLGEPASSREVG